MTVVGAEGSHPNHVSSGSQDPLIFRNFQPQGWWSPHRVLLSAVQEHGNIGREIYRRAARVEYLCITEWHSPENCDVRQLAVRKASVWNSNIAADPSSNEYYRPKKLHSKPPPSVPVRVGHVKKCIIEVPDQFCYNQAAVQPVWCFKSTKSMLHLSHSICTQ